MGHLILSIPDIIWVLSVLAGSVFSVVMLGIYGSRRVAVERIEDPVLRRLGREMLGDFVRAERLRFASHLTSLAIGVVAVLRDLPASWRGGVIVCGLLLINSYHVANSINAYLSWRRRHAIVNLRSVAAKGDDGPVVG